MLTVAILAGGLATRLRPITEKIPKALVEVAGRPFISRQLEYLRNQGLKRVVLCTGYLGEQIAAFVGDGSAFGLEVLVSPDGPTLMGTAGALKQAVPLLGDRFFVLYGDSFLPCDFKQIERAFGESGLPALMAVFRNAGRWEKSNAILADGRVVEYDKQTPGPRMEYIDYGLGVLSAEVFDSYPSGVPFDLATVYRQLSLSGELGGYEVHERFYEIGSHAGLKEAELYFLKQETV